MKKAEAQIGETYRVKVSGNMADVRITGENPHGGWDGINVLTNRKVRIKSAQRLRGKTPARPAKRGKIVSLAEYEAGAAKARAPKAKKARKATGKAKTTTKRHTGERDAKGGQPKRLSILDAAVKVLGECGADDGPLNCNEMVERMTAKGYWAPARGGKTPASTLYAAILREIRHKGDDSRFEKIERGKFALSQKR